MTKYRITKQVKITSLPPPTTLAEFTDGNAALNYLNHLQATEDMRHVEFRLYAVSEHLNLIDMTREVEL